MKFERFEDIVAWQKAEKLTLEVYLLTKNLKDFGFKDQLQRAVVSIMNNIAEGFERRGDKEFKQFLFIAKGSSGETRSMLHLGLKLKYFSESDFEKLYNLAEEISKMLSGLIKSLNRPPLQTL